MTTIRQKYNALYLVPHLVVQEEMPEGPLPFFDAIDCLARGETAVVEAGSGPPDAGELLQIVERLGSAQISAPVTLMRHLLAVLYSPNFVVFTKE